MLGINLIVVLNRILGKLLCDGKMNGDVGCVNPQLKVRCPDAANPVQRKKRTKTHHLLWAGSESLSINLHHTVMLSQCFLYISILTHRTAK